MCIVNNFIDNDMIPYDFSDIFTLILSSFLFLHLSVPSLIRENSPILYFLLQITVPC